jgi:hypothetical protein
MYEVLDCTAAQVILTLNSGDSIRQVAQRIHTLYETVRQAVNRLEGAGYVRYENCLSITEESVRDAARELIRASAGVSPPSIEEAYIVPQFGRLRSIVSTRSTCGRKEGYQVGRDPEDYPSFLAVRDRDIAAWESFFESFGLPTADERQPRDSLDGALQIILTPHSSLDVEHIEGIPRDPMRRDNRVYARVLRAVPVSARDARPDVR